MGAPIPGALGVVLCRARGGQLGALPNLVDVVLPFSIRVRWQCQRQLA